MGLSFNIRAAGILALAATAQARRNTEHYPYAGPCADHDDAAKGLFTEDDVYYGKGCHTWTANCGFFPIGEGGYDLVGHLCPETCGMCAKPHEPDSGVYRVGEDNDDLLAAMGFPGCADLMPLGYCSVDAIVRGMCQKSCESGCENMGFQMQGEKYGQGNNSQQGEQHCMGAPHDQCPMVTYGEAEDLCESWGAHMCHLEELETANFQNDRRWQDKFDKGADYVISKIGELPGPDYEGDEAEGNYEETEAGDETVVEGEVTMGGRPASTCDDQMDVWVHPQDASCHVGGGEGQLVARIGKGQNPECKAKGHKAQAICCHSDYNGIASIVPARKLLAQQPKLDWAKGMAKLKAASA